MLLPQLFLFSLTFTRLTDPVDATMADMIANILKHLVQKLESTVNLNNNNYSDYKESVDAVKKKILHEVDLAIGHHNGTGTVTSTHATQSGSSSLTPEVYRPVTTKQSFLTSTIKGINNSVTALLDFHSHSSSSAYEWRTSAVYLDYYNDLRSLHCVLPTFNRTVLENGNADVNSRGKRVNVYEQIFSSQVLARLQVCKQNVAKSAELAFCMGDKWNLLRNLSENWLNGRSHGYCSMIQCFDDVIKKAAEVPDWGFFLTIRMILSTLCALRPSLSVNDPLKDCVREVIMEAHIKIADILNHERSPPKYRAPSICYGDEVCQNIDVSYYNAIQRYRCKTDTTGAITSATQTAVKSTFEDANHTSHDWVRSTTTPSDVQETGTEETESPLDISYLAANSAGKSNDQHYGISNSTTEKTTIHGREFHVHRVSTTVTMLVPTCTLALLGIMIFTGLMCVRMRRKKKYRREAIGYEEVKAEDLP